MLEIRTPQAKAKEETRPMAESPCKPAFSLSLRITKEASVTIGIETSKGDAESRSAIATLAKLTCARPSPISESFFKTRNIPKKEQQRAISDPTKRALRIKSYLSASRMSPTAFSIAMPPAKLVLRELSKVLCHFRRFTEFIVSAIKNNLAV